MGEPWHGTRSGYKHHRCRCEACRQWNAEYCARARERRVQAVRNGSLEITHGYGGYVNYGCRCSVCGAAGREYLDRKKQQLAKSVESAQSLSLERATHRYQQWTGPELEVALREDLTAREAAALLGRTLFAVKNVRAKRSKTAVHLRKIY